MRQPIRPLALALALAACGGPEGYDEEPTETAAEALLPPISTVSCDVLLARFGRDRAWLREQVGKKFSNPSAYVDVTLTDEILRTRCFYRNKSASAEYPNSPFQAVGSVTKVVTATILARYLKEGRVTFGTTAASLLPGWSIPARCLDPACAESRPMTLIELANHSSGLPNMPTRASCAGSCGVDEHTYTHADFQASLAECRERRCANNLKPTYSNYGYALLGRALQAVRGYASYREMVRAEVLVPLDMPAVGFMFAPGDPYSSEPGACTSGSTPGCIAIGTGNTIAPYTRDGQKITDLAGRIHIPAWSPMAPAGGLWMLASDQAKFAAFALGATEVAALSGLDGYLFMPYPGDDSSDFYGLGWNLDVSDGKDDLFKGGSLGPGYRTFVLLDWRRTLGVTVATNVGNNTGADMEGLAYVLRDLVP